MDTFLEGLDAAFQPCTLAILLPAIAVVLPIALPRTRKWTDSVVAERVGSGLLVAYAALIAVGRYDCSGHRVAGDVPLGAMHESVMVSAEQDEVVEVGFATVSVASLTELFVPHNSP